MITWLNDFGLCPEENVEKDFRLFDGIDEFSTPVVARVHTFNTYCATTGYLSRLRHNTVKRFKEMAIPLLRRASGGGIALHGEDLCFSFFFDTTGTSLDTTYHRSAATLRQIVTDVLMKGTGFSLGSTIATSERSPRSEYCINRGDETDIFLGRQKIAGFGGRVRKNVFLLHLQVISSGWRPGMMREFAGDLSPGHGEYFGLKKFVFSRDFLENIKKEIDCAFSRQREKGRVSYA